MDNLNKAGLLDLLREYDSYIQNANDEDLYKSGWRPVCIEEYYDCEYQESKCGVCGKPEDEDGRCGCTNDDSK